MQKPGADRASGHYDKQADATDRARQIQENDGGGELTIQDEQGRIRAKDTIDRPDPFPPRG